MERLQGAIVGAGAGGLGLAARLRQAGESSFAIFDRADRVGGTWRANTYPGAPSHAPPHPLPRGRLGRPLAPFPLLVRAQPRLAAPVPAAARDARVPRAPDRRLRP